MRRIALAIQEFVTGLDSAMREVPRQDYIAYKIAQNIMCMEVHKAKVYLYLKLDPKAIGVLPAFARDVTEIGHFGTGDLELTLSSFDDVEKAKPFIVQAYERFGR
jgi:predicted transport protein